MKKHLLVVGVGAGLFWGFAVAQNPEMPKRKPGQWEMKVESTMMRGMVTAMEQCIDEKTDADMQKKSMQGQGKNDCKLVSSKKAAAGWEFVSVCKQEQTTITSRSLVSGDFSSAYRMDSTATFEPPMQGMKEMQSTMHVRYLGACKAGMKPGDMMVNGMKVGQGGLPTGRGQVPQMSAEDMKKMMEAMQKGRP